MGRIRIKFPANCRTRLQKLAFACDVREKLRREHNLQGKTLTPAEFVAWKRDFFLDRSAGTTRDTLSILTHFGDLSVAKTDAELADIDLQTVFEEDSP